MTNQLTDLSHTETNQPEYVLIRCDFYSDVTKDSHNDLEISRKTLDSGISLIEKKCIDLLIYHLKCNTLIISKLTLIDSNPQYAHYNEILSECFDSFQLTFTHKNNN